MEDMACSELRNIAETLEDSFFWGEGTIGFGKPNLFFIVLNMSVLNRDCQSTLH